MHVVFSYTVRTVVTNVALFTSGNVALLPSLAHCMFLLICIHCLLSRCHTVMLCKYTNVALFTSGNVALLPSLAHCMFLWLLIITTTQNNV